MLNNEHTFASIIQDVFVELDKAEKVHGEKFHNTMEWMGAFREECDELWDEIKNTKGTAACTHAMRKEAIQCVAVLLKGIRGFTKGAKDV